MAKAERVKGDLSIHPDRPRAGSRINDNDCVSVLQTGLLAGIPRTVNFVQSPETLSVKTMQTP